MKPLGMEEFGFKSDKIEEPSLENKSQEFTNSTSAEG